MKICKHCGHEIVETIIMKDLNLEGKPVEQHGVPFKDIKITKGWRIPTLQETEGIDNNYRKEFNLDSGYNDFFVKQPFKINKGKIARFLADSDWSYLNCNGVPSISYSSLGVLMVRDLKENK